MTKENTGVDNTGNRNSGYRNSGNWNSGNWNSGDRNSGNWNSGDRNTGYFNTITPEDVLLFNKPCKRDDFINCDKPDFLYFNLNVWVGKSDMTDEQKKEDPDFHVRGGQLQTRDYKEAFKESWDNADNEDKEKVFNLPNFDADIFLEISGIDVRESNKVTIELTQEQINKIKELGVI